jgi:hypothetical protein
MAAITVVLQWHYRDATFCWTDRGLAHVQSYNDRGAHSQFSDADLDVLLFELRSIRHRMNAHRTSLSMNSAPLLLGPLFSLCEAPLSLPLLSFPACLVRGVQPDQTPTPSITHKPSYEIVKEKLPGGPGGRT